VADFAEGDAGPGAEGAHMKRHHLLTLAPIALLWMRQVRFERRLSRRQGAFEREAGRNLRHYAQSVNETIGYGAKSWNCWGDELVKEINRGFKALR
jgi:hypothetical protein